MRGPELNDERGAVIVWFICMVPVVVLCGVFAVDVANWFVHKRHLQVRADAAALAGASVIRDTLMTTNACDPDLVTADGGLVEEYGVTRNPHIAGSDGENRTFLELNQVNFHDQSGPGDVELTGDPCADGAVDVKVSEADVPWYFKAGGVLPWVNAQARVGFYPLTARTGGSLPIAVEDPSAEAAAATFVDEATGTELATVPLTHVGISGGRDLWSGGTVSVPVSASRIGVRIALSRVASSTSCEDTTNVSCYDGMSFIRGYPTPSVAGADLPEVGDVRLLPAGSATGCAPDAYFTSGGGPCEFTLQAEVHFNDASQASLTASVDGGAGQALTKAADGVTWSRVITIDRDALNGRIPITLDWEQRSGKVRFQDNSKDTACSSGGSNKCKGPVCDPQPDATKCTTATVVQRVLSADEGVSGRMSLVQVGDASGATFGVNSLPRCSTCTADLTVTIGLETLQTAEKDDPPTIIRPGVQIGSGQYRSLDCDPHRMFDEEIESGCETAYRIHEASDGPCPAQTSDFGTEPPWPCVDVRTGKIAQGVAKGLNARLHDDPQAKICLAANNWHDPDGFAPDDPRILPVFVVPVGSFHKSGTNYTVPVVELAAFYITGYGGKGGGFSNPCAGDGDEDEPPDDSSIVGHFFKYVDTVSGGTPGTGSCQWNSIGGCVTVMTR